MVGSVLTMRVDSTLSYVDRSRVDLARSGTGNLARKGFWTPTRRSQPNLTRRRARRHFVAVVRLVFASWSAEDRTKRDDSYVSGPSRRRDAPLIVEVRRTCVHCLPSRIFAIPPHPESTGGQFNGRHAVCHVWRGAAMHLNLRPAVMLQRTQLRIQHTLHNRRMLVNSRRQGPR